MHNAKSGPRPRTRFDAHGSPSISMSFAQIIHPRVTMLGPDPISAASQIDRTARADISSSGDRVVVPLGRSRQLTRPEGEKSTSISAATPQLSHRIHTS
jgi:hypothetical protein